MFSAGHQLLTLLNSVYEGGAEKFFHEGGKVLPYPDDKGMFIYHPNMTEELTKKLMKYDTEDFKMNIVTTMNHIDILYFNLFTNELDKVYERYTIDPYNLVVYITFDKEYEAALYEKVTELIRLYLPCVYRSLIIFTDQNKLFINEPVRGLASMKKTGISKPTKVVIEPDTIQGRDLPIQPDEILNLKIELALSTDVLDFINSL